MGGVCRLLSICHSMFKHYVSCMMVTCPGCLVQSASRCRRQTPLGAGPQSPQFCQTLEFPLCVSTVRAKLGHPIRLNPTVAIFAQASSVFCVQLGSRKEGLRWQSIANACVVGRAYAHLCTSVGIRNGYEHVLRHQSRGSSP